MRVDVVLLMYRRPAHARAVVDSLVADGVSSCRVFVDRASEPKGLAAQATMVEDVAARDDLRAEIHVHERHLGLAASLQFAVGSSLERADAVIVLEDDCVVRRGAIGFFRAALETFRADRRVRSVCGYRYPCAFTHETDQPFLLRRFCPWGWATWRDRWRDFEPDLEQLMRSAPAANGALPPGLAELVNSSTYRSNAADIWSVSWAATHFLTDTMAAYPPVSLVDNIGFDGSGRHCTPTSVFATRAAPLGPMRWDRVSHLQENDQLVEAFLSQHRSEIYPAP